MSEQRAPRHFTHTVCSQCRAVIPKGHAKVSQGTGWICAACAYARYKEASR